MIGRVRTLGSLPTSKRSSGIGLLRRDGDVAVAYQQNSSNLSDTRTQPAYWACPGARRELRYKEDLEGFMPEHFILHKMRMEFTTPKITDQTDFTAHIGLFEK